MSASFSLRFGAGVAALWCLLMGYAGAQQASSTRSEPGASSNATDSSASGAGQSGRSSAVQSGQGTSQTYGQSARTRTANYGATTGATTATSGSNQEIEHFMANCLLAQNEAEVQLTELAQQQAQNSSVKEFAQKMAQDHRQMILQLQQIAGTQGSRSSSLGTSRSGATSATETTTTGTAGTSGTTTTTTDTTRNGRSGIGTTRRSTVSENDLPSTPGASAANESGRSSLSSSQTTDLAGGVASTTSGSALQQLGQLEKQILDRKMQLTKEDLQQKQGAEFDKCFVGTVIPAHVHMVAELEVLEKQGGQLAQIAQQARPIAQQHLDHAKQLIKQLEGQSTAAGSQAERKSSTRTE